METADKVADDQQNQEQYENLASDEGDTQESPYKNPEAKNTNKSVKNRGIKNSQNKDDINGSLIPEEQPNHDDVQQVRQSYGLRQKEPQTSQTDEQAVFEKVEETEDQDESIADNENAKINQLNYSPPIGAKLNEKGRQNNSIISAPDNLLIMQGRQSQQMKTNFQYIDEEVLEMRASSSRAYMTNRNSHPSRMSNQRNSKVMSNYTAKKVIQPEDNDIILADEDTLSNISVKDNNPFLPKNDQKQLITPTKASIVVLTEEDMYKSSEMRNLYLKKQITLNQISKAQNKEDEIMNDAIKQASEAGCKNFLFNQFIQTQFMAQKTHGKLAKLTPVKFRTS